MGVSRPSVKGRLSFQRLGPNAWHLWTSRWLSHPTSSPLCTSCYLHLQSHPECVSLQPCWCQLVQLPGPAGRGSFPVLGSDGLEGLPRPCVKPRSCGALCPGPRPSGFSPAPLACLCGCPTGLLAQSAQPCFFLSGTFVLQFPPPELILLSPSRLSIPEAPRPRLPQGCSPPPLPARDFRSTSYLRRHRLPTSPH